jgi:serine protease Do
MRSWIIRGLLALILPCGMTLSAVVAQQPSQDLEALEEEAVKQAVALVAPSVVRIETVGGLDRVGQVLTGTAPTTGVVVSADGYVISSAFNFASKPASILVTLADGRRFPAEQVAMDQSRMLTLLKVAGDNLSLTPAQAAPDDGIKVGQWAIALGRTYNSPQPSVSLGIVSAVKRIWGKALQTDAKISPVNYGGPLIDIEGRVLGVLVPLSPQATGQVAGVEWYDSGIGFAIPLADVYAALPRLKLGKDLFPGLMGITVKGRDIYEGQPTIDRVRYGSPAYDAKLKDGDQIVEIDGRKIVRHAQILHALGNKYAGDKIVVKIKRGTEELSRDLTLVDKLVPYESAYLGVLPNREPVSAPAVAGVTVRYVFADSPAQQAGIERGDVIVRCQDRDATTSSALLDQISRQRPGDKVKLTVRRGTASREIEVALTSLPDTIADDLRAVAVPAGAAPAADKAGPKLGKFEEDMPAHEHKFWAYVPEDYNADHRYSLLVWIHPGRDTMEADITKHWKPLCDEKGIILLAPKAKQPLGWNADESEFVKDAVELMLEKYAIDKSRIVLHSMTTSGPFAYQLAFKHRDLFHGVNIVQTPLTAPPPDNEPEHRVQFLLYSFANDAQHKATSATATGLRGLKFPVTLRVIEDGATEYPSNYADEMSRWLDALDRI